MASSMNPFGGGSPGKRPSDVSAPGSPSKRAYAPPPPPYVPRDDGCISGHGYLPSDKVCRSGFGFRGLELVLVNFGIYI